MEPRTSGEAQGEQGGCWFVPRLRRRQLELVGAGGSEVSAGEGWAWWKREQVELLPILPFRV